MACSPQYGRGSVGWSSRRPASCCHDTSSTSNFDLNHYEDNVKMPIKFDARYGRLHDASIIQTVHFEMPPATARKQNNSEEQNITAWFYGGYFIPKITEFSEVTTVSTQPVASLMPKVHCRQRFLRFKGNVYYFRLQWGNELEPVSRIRHKPHGWWKHGWRTKIWLN